MKKGLLLAGVLAVFMGSAANAQRLHYGLKANLLLNSIQGDGLESSFSPGFQGGAFLELDFNKKFGIQPELLFTQSTNKKADDFATFYPNSRNTQAREKIKTSAITVPLLLRYTPIPAVTLNIGAQYTNMFFIDENLLKASVGDAFKKSDIGGVAGVTINVANVRFYGRYVLGLVDINNIPSPEKHEWKTQQITIGLGVAFK
jgi:hypothetical protein